MVPHNGVFKGDTVYYLDKPTKGAYIGSVVMSDDHPTQSDTEVTHDKCEKDCTVKVDWRAFGLRPSSSIPSNLKPNETHFLDRSYMPGEVVQNLDTNMIGTISNVYMTAHAEILGYEKFMFDIHCDHLRSVYPWTTHVDENYVIWNSWLGRVSDCRLMAIIRFLDGARLLVGDSCLGSFEPFLSVPDEYMNHNFEGAWLFGDALDLRCNMNSSESCKFDFLSLSRNASFEKYHKTDILANSESPLISDASNKSHQFNETFPPGHPIKFLQALAQYPVTKTFSRHPEQISCLLKRTPIFLVETRAHNAVWLSRLKSSVDVVFYVEHFAPVEATIHWFANRNSQSDKPPPRVVHGLDLGNLKSVVSNAFINCQIGDIWYYRLQESDKIYDMNDFTRPEQLLYKWFTKDISRLGVGRSPPPPFSLLDDKQTGEEKLNEDDQDNLTSASSVTHQKTSGILEDKISKNTTPFWAQVNLFASRRRRRRVIVDPRRRISSTDIFQWAQRFRRSTSSFTSYIDIHADISDRDCDATRNDDDAKGDEKQTINEKNHQQQEASHTKEHNHQMLKLTCKRISCDNPISDNKAVSNPVESTIKIDLTSGASTTLEPTVTLTPSSLPTITPTCHTTDTHGNSLLSPVDNISSDATLNNSTINITLPPLNQVNTDDRDGRLNDNDHVKAKEDECFMKKMKFSKHSKRLSAMRQQIQYIQEKCAAQLRTNDWIPVRIYATHSVYDIKWIDGSVSKGLTSDKILSFGGHIEHYLLPGYVVSLKSDKSYCSQPIPLNSPVNDFSSGVGNKTLEKLNTSSSIVETSSSFCDHQRDLGVVLSYNIRDRTCLVQWFEIGNTVTGSLPIMPIGSPEEIGVYEISGSGEYQMNFGDIILIKSANDTDYSIYPAGILQDIIPESGKLLIRWIDGTSSEVYRTDCLEVIEADDDSTSDEDSFDSDFSDSEYGKDEKWESYSTSSSYSDLSSTSTSSCSSSQSENDNDSTCVQITQPTYEEDLRPVGVKLLLASQHVTSAHRLFSDRFTFVLWLMRCFVTISGIADDILEQVYSALRSAALIDPKGVNTVSLDNSTISLNTSRSGNSTNETSLSKRKENVWSDVDEVEAISCVEMLNTGRSLLYEAFKLVKDYRIRKMWHMCDFRSNLFEKHIGAILRFFESFPPSTYEQEIAKLSNSVDLISLINGIITKLATFLHDLQKDILGQLTDLNNEITAWLHECASQCLQQSDLNDFLVTTGNGFDQRIIVNESESDKPIIELKSVDNGQVDDSEANVKSACELEMSTSTTVTGYSPSKVVDDSASTNVTTENVEVASTVPSSKAENIPVDPVSVDFSVKSILSNPTVESLPVEQRGQFIMEPTAPSTHRFYKSSQKTLPKAFHKALKRDITLLSTILPRDIIVKGFEDRINLYSIMIVGASGTPYEHCLFFFDIGLPSSYPTTPPQVHYYSFGNERVNPNLYVDGHICLSLLGTWNGQGTENWSAETSNLLQLVISIQGLILNSEPYFNEANYEERRTDPVYQEQSRIYNEAVIALNLQSMISIVQNPFPTFRQEIIKHCVSKYKEYLRLLECWTSLDYAEYERIKTSSDEEKSNILPVFPLPPISKGFQLSVRRHSVVFSNLVQSLVDSDCITTD
ncbi:(E3-independent) E2 ubiquitin-conjugating enzyme UBE2O [Schistosoma japonicum]|uniref:(E3-independent) E2 ubiquitin-conjugating enzyme UBE2O n=1 Tax=Schistosoma japonicum TaxID=6182 RepID=A0A4Z2D4R1_SCHJA|nr:(E3-independent) E2 ubiquitin-conjugating enzyme UBE2O [Schistosoma japonicum]